ncbi:MAG TPA: FG-GAP-like repeat-containing protein [Vicinamibacteria bacterium]|nr:FG-GAP-like repeat-containing protein [Vicinamibacteria bacterium]
MAGRSTVRVALAFTLVCLAALPTWASDWFHFNFDARHSGNNTQETAINAANVSTLHVLYHVSLPSIADGAPAFLSGVATPSGTKDLLFLNTKDGHILALDAATGATMWSHQPATGPNYTTSSPAVDPGRLFVYAYALDGKVHKYQVGDGTEITTGGWPELATLKPDVEKGSSALSVVTTVGGTTYLYVTNGGYPGDAGDYQGHVTAIDLATGAQKVFNANCSNNAVHFVEGGTPDCPQVQSAIWARVGVVYDSDNDKIFMATGNGTFDAFMTGKFDWGDSVFALHPDGTGNGLGQPVDSYTPTNYQALQNGDADLGSTAPAILPVLPGSKFAHLGVQSGKDALIRLLNLDNLSGAGAPGHTAGEVQTQAVPQGGEVLTALAVWTNPADNGVWVFVANGSGISGLQATVDGSGNPSLASKWSDSTAGASPIVANSILYYASAAGARALDPVKGTQLWSASIGGVHWESPIVINGHLFVTDEGSQLWAYGPTNRDRAIDFDGDHKTDLAVFNPSSGLWYIRHSSDGSVATVGYGGTGYIPVPGDYDGDGKTDIAVYHPPSGLWFIRYSSTGVDTVTGFGGTNYVPVRGDFDGDGKTDLAVFHDPTGIWFIKYSSTGTVVTVGYGATGYIPVPGDYEGIGKTDLAVYYPPSGLWFIRNSSTGATTTVGFGGTGYTPVRGDFDGDGKNDVAVFNDATGLWFIRNSSTGTVVTVGYGATGYIPVPGGYEDIGKTELAVYHPPTGLWFVRSSLNGGTTTTGFGGPGFNPVN